MSRLDDFKTLPLKEIDWELSLREKLRSPKSGVSTYRGDPGEKPDGGSVVAWREWDDGAVSYVVRGGSVVLVNEGN